jgi:hypothetical protein
MSTRLILAAALAAAITVTIVAGARHRSPWLRVDRSEPEPNVHVERVRLRAVPASA